MRFTAFRNAAYDSPWWAAPSSREGRFHRAGQDTVQYCSLHPLGPAAEMLRHNVGPDGDPDDVLLNLWTAMIDVDDVTRIDSRGPGSFEFEVTTWNGPVFGLMFG